MFGYAAAAVAVVEGLEAMYGGKTPPESVSSLMVRMKKAQHFMVQSDVVEQLSQGARSKGYVDLEGMYMPFEDVYLQVENPNIKTVSRLGFFFHRHVGLARWETMQQEGKVPELAGILVLFHADHTAQMVATFTLFTDGTEELVVQGENDPNAPPTLREVLESEFSRALIVLDATTQGVLTEYVPSKFRRPGVKRNKQYKLISYKLLKLDLSKREQSLEVGHGHHASPRLHLRRGHWRVYKNGHRKWIKPMWVGDKEKGYIHKDYEVTA